MRSEPHLATRLVHRPPVPGDPARPASTPLYQTATFALEPDGGGRWDYTRSGNPTRDVLEAQLAALDGATASLAYASGMAALAAVLRLVPPGGRVVVGHDLYGGTWRLLNRLCEGSAIAVRAAAAPGVEALAEAAGTAADLLLVESPTNPFLTGLDIPAAAAVAHAAGALLAVDNSLVSALRQRPLALGADLAVQSATKVLGGHSDLTAGVVSTGDPDLARRLADQRNTEGNALAPFESWLLLRGLETLVVRLDRQEATALRLGRLLADEPAVCRLHQPAREPRGALLSFETGDPALSRAFLRALSLFRISVSFGGVTSTASLPARMSHASMPAAERERRGIGYDLVRLSVGLEDPGDLEDDLDRAFRRAARATGRSRSRPRSPRHVPPSASSCTERATPVGVDRAREGQA